MIAFLHRRDAPDAAEGERPLSSAAAGEPLRLVSLGAGRELRTRLAALGLFPGTELSLSRASRSGPVVVRVKGARIVLGRSMAELILVAPRAP